MTTGLVLPAADGSFGFSEDISQIINVLTGKNDGGSLSLLQPLAAPLAPTVNTSSSGSITGTGYQWGVYWITGTQTKNQSAVTVNNIVGTTAYGSLTTATGTITLKEAIVSISGLTVPTGAIGWGVVRNKSGGGTWYEVPSSQQFLTGGSMPSSFTDNVVDASLVTAAPATNTTGTTLQNAAWVLGSSANPAGTSGTSYVMAGMGSSIVLTPKTTGTTLVTLTGYAVNVTESGDAGKIQLAYGTGTAPSAGAAATGTTFGNSPQYLADWPNATWVSVALQGGLNLGVGTTYWFDFQQLSGGSGATFEVLGVVMTAIEII